MSQLLLGVAFYLLGVLTKNSAERLTRCLLFQLVLPIALRRYSQCVGGMKFVKVGGKTVPPDASSLGVSIVSAFRLSWKKDVICQIADVQVAEGIEVTRMWLALAGQWRPCWVLATESHEIWKDGLVTSEPTPQCLGFLQGLKGDFDSASRTVSSSYLGLLPLVMLWVFSLWLTRPTSEEMQLFPTFDMESQFAT